jgi:hypothetical protein
MKIKTKIKNKKKYHRGHPNPYLLRVVALIDQHVFIKREKIFVY